MSATLSVPYALVKAAKLPRFVDWVARIDKQIKDDPRRYEEPEEYEIGFDRLNDNELGELTTLALGNDKFKNIGRVLESVQLARKGDFSKPVARFPAFEPTLKAYLMADLIDGWIYVKNDNDGLFYPELVLSIETNIPRNQDSPSTTIKTIAYQHAREGRNGGMRVVSHQHGFDPSDVARRRVGDALAASNIYHETPELKATWEAEMKRWGEVIHGGFAQQYRLDGSLIDGENFYRRERKKLSGRKVIHDLAAEDYDTRPSGRESKFFDRVLDVPEHPTVRVFDLTAHELVWVHESALTPYKYDKTLKDKLILPDSHRDLLDVLTTDLEVFTGDLIEGKSAGNIVLGVGIPGVGKTLTAEIYSEAIEKPLYSVRTGLLGTTPSSIEEGLKTLFERQKRWGCVLLLDEADVFVGERGDNIDKNAIVAEFLRVLEYFDGLLFMTTNRPDDIDEAIISRCAAILRYEPPADPQRLALWVVMFKNFGVEAVRPSLLDSLVREFPKATGRDIKMLLRLALRFARFHNEDLSADIFRRCAMFRDVEIAKTDDLI